MESLNDPYSLYAKTFEIENNIESYSDFIQLYYNLILRQMELHLNHPKMILDLGCGTGELGKLFLDKGYIVHGVDISPAMVSISKAKGIKATVDNFISFQHPNIFDVVTCTYDSLNYIPTANLLEVCFFNVFNHLKPRGLFIFDLNSDYKIKNIPSLGYEYEYGEVGEDHYIWKYSGDNKTWVMDLMYFQKQTNEVYIKQTEKHIEYGYPISIIKDIINKVRFQIISISASNEKQIEIEDKTMRWFFVIQKQS